MAAMRRKSAGSVKIFMIVCARFTNHFATSGRASDRALDSYNKGVGSLKARAGHCSPIQGARAIAGEDIEILEPIDKSAGH